MKEKGKKLIAQNKKARYDYAIEDVLEAGIVLVGTEVKSLRAGRASLLDGFAQVKNGEVWLHNVHIPEYEAGTWTNHEPRRVRKLLIKKLEINRLIKALHDSGATLVPLSIYFKDGKAKVELAVGKGKKEHDKRQSLKEKMDKKEVARAVGRRSKGVE
jgi:SsrA-binding protein